MSGRHYHFFGSILRDMRHDRHLGAAETARRAGVPEGTWLQWEEERAQPTEIEELHGISQALDIPVGEVWASLFMDLAAFKSRLQ